MSKLCRWGILGTAGIAQKNWAAIRNSGNGIVVGVASRSADRAGQFISQLQAQVPFDIVPTANDYEALLARKDVDAVYIPLPTGLRAEWVIKAANAGKHVMCEKPCAIDAAQLKKMIDACQKNNVQFMDGVMYMHSQRMQELRKVLDDGTSIGEIRRIAGQFSFLAPEDFLTSNIRMSSELEPQGSLGDLGWYLIRFALWTMNFQMPTQVSSRMLAQRGRADSPTAVPMEVSSELLFEGGVSAGFYCSFLNNHQQFVHVSGTKGNLQVADFVLPNYGNEVAFNVSQSDFNISGSQFDMENYSRRVAVREFSNNTPNSQESKLFRNFADIVLSGRLDAYWPEISLKTQIVLDACLESARNDARLVQISSAGLT
ncbi:Gfo/Idh/MocA family protein [Planctomicrobium sp. SH668]|uniref:Gfo/Idh/MocA family protein n=1 Tax=Planctomicrobium sp. SH668 TaxID=3448126 RepID=UPI003F5B726B